MVIGRLFSRVKKKPTKTAPKPVNKPKIRSKTIKKVKKAKKPVKKVNKPIKKIKKPVRKIKPVRKAKPVKTRSVARKPVRKPVKRTPVKAHKAIAKKAKPARKPKAAKIKPIKPAVKQAKAAVQSRPAVIKPMQLPKEANMKEVGRVTHYFDKISVAVVKLDSTLRQGDYIEIKGTGTNIKQRASSIQVNHAPISVAREGDMVGLLVAGKAKPGDRVFRYY